MVKYLTLTIKDVSVFLLDLNTFVFSFHVGLMEKASISLLFNPQMTPCSWYIFIFDL